MAATANVGSKPPNDIGSGCRIDTWPAFRREKIWPTVWKFSPVATRPAVLAAAALGGLLAFARVVGLPTRTRQSQRRTR